MKFRSCLLIAFSFCFLFVRAQELPRTLLWRIGGKDGHHISYLYGTMHLTDDRLFNLGDSLYAAIAHSDGFAMELDPDALTSLMIDEIQKRIVHSKNIKDLLSEQEYKSYGPRLATKLGKPLADITSEDILREKNRWITEAYHKGMMPTFLDTYLFDIARRQNKWTGGVEDAEDQRGLLDDAVDESDIRFLVSEDQDSIQGHRSSVSLSSMIDVYADQNLSAIDSMESNVANRDVLLIKRNRKMALRMDSLSGVRSMVFAVGAAHLPGEAGLISLLRKRGFDVEPVFSSRKIKASDYAVKELPRTWEEVRDEDSIYLVSMPGKPGNIQVYGVINMKMYFDLFEGIGYFSTAVQSIYSEAETDSLMDNWAKVVFKAKIRKGYKTINLFGARGRVYEGTDEDGYKKGMILSKDNMVYLVYAVSWQESAKNTGKANQFIESFRMLKRDRRASDTSMLTFIPHIDSAMAYEVSTPVPAKRNNMPVSKEGWDSRTFISVDPQSGIYYMFGVNGVTRGHYIPNDSAYFFELRKAALTKVTELVSDTSWMMGDSRVVEFRGGMQQGGYEMITRYIARGNRWYPLVVMYPRKMAGAPVIDRFLSSFRLLDYPAHRWQVSTPVDSIYRAWSPSPIFIDTATEGHKMSTANVRYFSFDSSRSMGYSVTALHLNPYYWSNSDSAFWADRISADVSYLDTLVEKHAVKNGDIRGWDWLECERGSHVFVRRRALLYGDELYYLFAAGLPNELETDNVNRFFDDFRFLRPAAPSTIFQPKAEQLLKDLSGEDSAKMASARRYLHDAPFTAKDLPLLHQALLQIRHGWEEGIEGTLTRRITELHDSSSFVYAAKQYLAVPDTAVALKNDLLEIMTEFADSAHYAVLANLLGTRPPGGNLSFPVRYQLIRVPGLMASIIPGLLPLLEDSLIRPSMIFVVNAMADSGRVDSKALAPYRDGLERFAGLRLRKLRDSTSDDIFDGDLIPLLGRFNDVRSNTLLQKFLGVKDNYLRKRALTALLDNKQEPAAAGVQALAADMAFRLDAYRALKKSGRIALFPAMYRSPKAIGVGLVREAMEEGYDDDVDVDSIGFVTSLVRDIGQGKQKFYFYRVYAGDAFLACAGPFALTPPATAGWYNDDGKAYILFENQYDPEKQGEQIEQLLSKFTEDKKEP